MLSLDSQHYESRILAKYMDAAVKLRSLCSCDMGRSHGAEWKLKTGEDTVVRLLDSNKHTCLLALPLHSHVLLARSGFFAACLSERWKCALHHPSNSSCDMHISGRHDSHDLSEAYCASSCNLDVITSRKCDDFQHNQYDALLHNDHLENGRLHAIDIEMPDPSAAIIYKRCIELMYVPCDSINSRRPFSGVEDALSMLHVAAELLFHDCVDACMQFLEMLPVWNHEDEASIRSTLSSLQLPHINVDLAARLSLPQSIPSNQPMHTIRRMLVHVLQLSCERLASMPPALKSIDPSKPIAEGIILVAWNANLDLIKRSLEVRIQKGIYVHSDMEMNTASSSLTWLLSKLVALQVADEVVKAFAKDTQLSNMVRDLLVRNPPHYNYWSSIDPVLSILNEMMLVVQHGDVLLSRSARCTLITTWLPVAQGLTYSHCTSYSYIVDCFPKLISSLPVLDREHIFKNFLKMDDNGCVSLDSMFGPWCDMLMKIHMQHGQGKERLLVKNDARSI